MKLSLGMSNIQCSFDDKHSNKMTIVGAITKVDEPSGGAPCGANGKNVVFTKEGAEGCVKSFISMPVNCTFPEGFFADGTDVFTGHGDINFGVIEDAWVEGNDLMARIIAWKETFPDIAWMVMNGKDALGFSIECDILESSEEEDLIYINRFVGTGCALLWKNVAAFSDTYIRELAASRRKVEDSVNKEEMQSLFDGFLAKVDEKIAAVQAATDAKMEEVKASIEASNAKVEEIKASVEASDEKIDEIKASVEGKVEEIKAGLEIKPPAPTAGQGVIPNGDLTDTKEVALQKIHANKELSMEEKLREIVKINAMSKPQ